MLWVVYAILSALFLSASDALTKKGLESTDEYIIAWFRLLFAIPYLVIYLVLFINIPPIDIQFWLIILLSVPLELIALVLYTKAIKYSPLSLTIPFLAFTPIFLIVTSFFMLGELPDKAGLLGISLITLGAYTLNINNLKDGFLGPIRSIKKEKGSILMLCVAFIYSITSNLGKLAIQHSSPVFFGTVYFIVLAIAFSPIALIKSRQVTKNLSFKVDYLLIGLSLSLEILFHVMGITLTNVAYMIGVKRISLLFSSIYGYLFFGEKKIVERLIGVFLMLIGIVLITI